MARWALVTGAAGDLGRAACLGLGADGWAVQATDHPSQHGRLERTADACRAAGVTVVADAFDVTDAGATAEHVARLADHHGVATAVVVDAGVQGAFRPVDRYDIADLRRVLEVNVVGAFLTLQASAQAMIGAGAEGAIVLAASMAGVSGAPNMSAYSASKAALVGLAKSAAKDLAPHGIRVNAVSPAFIGPGAMWDNQVAAQAAAGTQYFATAPEAVAQQMLDMIPLRRYGSPDEVADVVCFLAGERSSYVTGVNLEINGGSA
jgi:NAD(P)-dependent dehydrogenase (short-subunit alcohol dehydrogenase family)